MSKKTHVLPIRFSQTNTSIDQSESCHVAPRRRTSKFRLTWSSAIVILTWSGFSALGTVYNSDGTAANVRYLHDNFAQDGDTITLPVGTFTWSIPVSISKAIKLQGGGSGRIVGNTKTSITIGTGARTFTTTRIIPGIVAGQTLRIAKMPNRVGYPSAARENYMEGTVTSYSGTMLTMNVTQTGGSGIWTFWWIATQPQTTIINNYNNGSGNNNGATPVLKVSEPSSGSAEISGLQMTEAAGSNSALIGLYASQYTAPKTLIRDCWFQTGNTDRAAIYAGTNHALIWNCSFDNSRWSSNIEGIQVKWGTSSATPSWSTNSTFGMNDTNGATNFYVEDCDFHAYLTAADFDDNARVVWRHNIMDNVCFGTHGADTSPIGVRHFEIYDNELVFDNFGANCEPQQDLQWFFWVRGGTGVIADNMLPAIQSQCGGTKANIAFSVLNTRRNSGPFCCWTNYPAPHQVGQGYGIGAVFYPFTSACGAYNGENHSHYIYFEPVYIWNNVGTGGDATGLNQDPTDECGNGQQIANYVQQGRDYLIAAKPGYAKFTYPHPLRSQPSPTPTPEATPTPIPSPTPTVSPMPTPTATPRLKRHRPHL